MKKVQLFVKKENAEPVWVEYLGFKNLDEIEELQQELQPSLSDIKDMIALSISFEDDDKSFAIDFAEGIDVEDISSLVKDYFYSNISIEDLESIEMPDNLDFDLDAIRNLDSIFQQQIPSEEEIEYLDGAVNENPFEL